MKTHKRNINGIEVKAYNDSNCDWVVILGDHRERFPVKRGRKGFSMKESMEFMIELFGKEG